MTVLLESIERIEQCNTPEIRARYCGIKKSKITICYRALVGKTESAFTALDRWPDFLVVYELFVSSELRAQGIGSSVLNEIERVAMQEGFPEIRLRPSPLEAGGDSDRLVEWYRKRGYVINPSVSNEMKKTLPH